MSIWLYHMVPPDLIGGILYPLNQLQTILPSIYEKQIAKYQGREWVMQQTVPILNCFWNDVVHLSLVHPSQIVDGLRGAGFSWRHRKFFEIDPSIAGFNSENAVIYIFEKNLIEMGKGRETNFSPYDSALLAQLAHIRPETLKYFKDMNAQHRQPLLFMYVPHVLFRGVIDIRKARTIEI